MKLALVTTPPSLPSGIGDYTRHLLPHLLERCEVELFVAPGLQGETLHGLKTRAADELRPREFHQIVYQLGNERHHAFQARMVRSLGGAVVLHDWVLFDLALAAFPALARGGIKGHLLALREGGLAQARLYSENWRARRRQRREPQIASDPRTLPGVLLSGWHAPEPGGRWTADVAWFRVPSPACTRVRVRLRCPAGRRVRFGARAADGVQFEATGDEETELALDLAAPAELFLETSPVRVTEEQRRHGDTRRLGCFVRGIEYEAAGGRSALDLREASREPVQEIYLTRDRFELALNRSVVRFADAFLVHSEYLRERILAERNAPTAIGVVHHGAQPRWRDGDRREARGPAGLPAEWRDDFILTSFGALQPHKRLDKLLEALLLARRARPRLRLVLIGSEEPEALDVRALVQRLALEESVHFAGRVEESAAWDLLHAGDLAVQLRGPSTGGSSGALFQSLSMGRAVVASESPELRSLPPSCVVRIPIGGDEAQRLAETLVRFCDQPAELEAMESAARRFVSTECAWPQVARAYCSHLESFPIPRSARRSLLSR